MKESITFLSKTVAYLVLVALVVILLYYFSAPLRDSYAINQASISALIQSSGMFGWSLYVLLVAIMVLGPLPSTALGLIGGYVFNPVLAFALTMLGEFIGASFNFFIGHKLIRSAFKRGIFPRAYTLIEQHKHRFGLRFIFFLSLIPMGTANITGYAAGLSGIKFRAYITVWLLGIGILSFFTTFLGHSAKVHDYALTIILGVSALLILASWKYYLSTKHTHS